MSKPYSPSSAPEFAIKPDYSDILGISSPPQSESHLGGRASSLEYSPSVEPIIDPWVSQTSIEQAPQSPADRKSVV